MFLVFGKPAKLRLTRHDDMLATGKRHDFLSLYKVGLIQMVGYKVWKLIF